MASLTRWMWVWASSGSWWWTGKPGMLQSMGSQRVEHDWVTELNWENLSMKQVSDWLRYDISGWTYQLIRKLPIPQVFQRNPFCILTSLLVYVYDTILFHRAAICLTGQFEIQCLASFRGLRVTPQKLTCDETNDWRWKRALNGTGRSDCTVWRCI